MDLSNVFAFDTETTDVDTKKAHVVEVALYNETFEYCKLVKPPIAIPPEVSAIHHICDADVELADTRKVVFDRLRERFASPPIPVFVAHNASYDKDIFSNEFPVIWICTYKAALRIWPDAPNHKNETLRYWLRLGQHGRSETQATHSALHDCKVTWLLLLECLKHATLEQLVQWTEEPAQLTKMPFGKHAGKKWHEIDTGYLTWVTNNINDNPDLIANVRTELKRRGR